MSRRFQFSLKTIFAIVATVAVAVAIFIRLPLEIRLAIGAVAFGAFFWLVECGPSLPDLIVRGQSHRKYVIKHPSNDADAADRKD